MSAHNMHPNFTDRAGYVAWRKDWRLLYKRQTQTIRRDKRRVKELQRAGSEDAAKAQRELHYAQVMARKTMTLLESAKIRWSRLRTMEAQIAEQMAGFPLTLENCPIVDFHFNKGSLEFPVLPAWTIKARGRTYYVHHLDFSEASGSTRETPDHPSTKGAIRFRHCTLVLEADGTAKIQRRGVATLAA